MSRPSTLQRPAATNPPPEQHLLRLRSPRAERTLSEASRRVEGRARAEGFRRPAGVDEAGRGPWAGPVVAAAVVLRIPRLPARIDDSKRLTPAQRERAFDVIVRHAEVGLGIVCAETIDARNILAATFLAMQHAVEDLPAAPDLVLVDGSLAPPMALPCWPIVHGDAVSYPIACASIIAKVTRDRLMRFYHRLLPEYAFDQHKGYGTPAHLEALQRHGPSVLHRLSFHPVSMIHEADDRRRLRSGLPSAHRSSWPSEPLLARGRVSPPQEPRDRALTSANVRLRDPSPPPTGGAAPAMSQ